MAGSVNKVILLGNLGRDPEVRQSQDGFKIVQLSVATSESWKDKNSGERKEKTEWHRVVIMNERLSEIAEKYLRKGSKIYLEGQLQTRKWTDPQGQEKYTTEVLIGRFKGELTLMDSRTASDGDFDGIENSRGDTNRFPSGGNAMENSGYNSYQRLGNTQELDDDIPF